MLSLSDRLRQLADLVPLLELAGVIDITAAAHKHGASISISPWPTLDNFLRAAPVVGATGIEWTPTAHMWTAKLLHPIEGVEIDCRCLPSAVPAGVMAALYPVPVSASIVVPL